MSLPSPWDDGKPRFKAAKGTSWMAARERRKEAKAFEDGEKDKVRKRDKVCRWPHCEHCKGPVRPRLEVAHLRAKGYGGDHGTRSSADQMILLDFLTHQSGPESLEQHGRRIEPLTSAGTNGPCAFFRIGEDGREYMVAEELSVGGPYRRD